MRSTIFIYIIFLIIQKDWLVNKKKKEKRKKKEASLNADAVVQNWSSRDISSSRKNKEATAQQPMLLAADETARDWSSLRHASHTAFAQPLASQRVNDDSHATC